MAKAKYLKSVKNKDFQLCMDQITPFVYNGDFKQAFEILDEFRIGANTLNPRKRNFAFWLVEAQSMNGRSTTNKQRRMFFEFSKQFIDKGVEIDHQDKDGLTLLNWSIYQLCGDICLFLLERGASPNIPDVYNLPPPLAYSMNCMATRWKYCYSEMIDDVAVDIMPALLRAGADPYFAYPTFDEIQKDSLLSWALNEEHDNVVYSNFMENIIANAQSVNCPSERLAVYKLFFDTCKEINALKGDVPNIELRDLPKKLTKESALAFLREHQPMPNAEENDCEDLLKEWSRVCDYFTKNPCVEALPLFFGSIGGGENKVYQKLTSFMEEFEPEEVVQYFIEALNSPSRIVREETAAMAWGISWRNSEFVEALLQRVEDEKETAEVREWCSLVLSEIAEDDYDFSSCLNRIKKMVKKLRKHGSDDNSPLRPVLDNLEELLDNVS